MLRVRGVETGNLVGSDTEDALTLSGRQLDTILIGPGGIDLGDGVDMLNLTSASADLAVLAGTDASIVGLERISFAGAARGIVLDLSAQSEEFALTGGIRGDKLTGGSGDDTITGGDGSDRLAGEAGADTIAGNAGVDRLTGGEGSDSFVLENTLASYDIINDFVSGTDVLQIDANLFGGGLAEGALVGDRFAAATNPLALVSASSDGRFLFDNAGSGAGRVYWDVNGGAATDAVLVAVLTGVTNLAASDFLIV